MWTASEAAGGVDSHEESEDARTEACRDADQRACQWYV